MSNRRIVPLALALALACGDRSADPAGAPRAGAPQDEWLSESAYRFGDVMAGDALFGRVYVRVTGDNRRVIVVEPLQSRVSIWTPDGRRLADLGGPGEGPGDLTLPSHVDLDDTGFYVRDDARFSFFSYDGMPLGTVSSLPTSVSWQGHYIQARVVLDDGSFLGYPLIPASIRFGLWGDDPIHTTPVLRVRKTGGRWVQNEVLRYNHRNATLRVPIGRDGSYFAAQRYSDSDWPRWDRETASVLLGRCAGEDLRPGEAELVEVGASGDTVWRRRVDLAAVRLTPARLDSTLDSLEALLRRKEEARPGILGLGGRSARDLAKEVLYAPEYLPAFRSFMLSASSGQVWFQTQERRDTLSVWYSIERGDTVTPPRRVLLPESLEVHDANATHVWGRWVDELGVNYVVGRRLLPPP